MFFNVLQFRIKSWKTKLENKCYWKLSTSMYIFIACCSIKQFLFFNHKVLKGATTAHKIHKDL